MKSKRQNEILKMLLLEHNIKSEDLVSRFEVSIETIRRDIDELEKQGVIKKVYGGISLPSNSLRITSIANWQDRLEQSHKEKVKIVMKALDFIEDNSAIALDIGTTTCELSRLLGTKRNLSVITNSLLISSELAKNTQHSVYCIGGMVQPNELITGGVFARSFLDNFASIDLFLGSADGLTISSGITEFNETGVEIKKQLIKLSRKRIAMVDYSKFGQEALFFSWGLDEIDVFITDDKAPNKELNYMSKLGIDVIVAK